MANLVYDSAKIALGNGGLNWTTADIRLLLLKSTGAYVPSVADLWVSSLAPASNECSGATYARKPLSSRVITRDDVNGRALYDAADLTWASAAFQATKAAVIYLYNVADASAMLICYFDFLATPNGADLTLQFSSTPVAAFTLT